MGKKLVSTIALGVLSVAFFFWGIAMLTTPGNGLETRLYGFLILCCAIYACISLLLLPRKNDVPADES